MAASCFRGCDVNSLTFLGLLSETDWGEWLPVEVSKVFIVFSSTHIEVTLFKVTACMFDNLPNTACRMSKKS